MIEAPVRGKQEGSPSEEPRDESLAEMGKFAQDHIRDEVTAELGYSLEDLDRIHPPASVSHEDDLEVHGPLHTAKAVHRDTQNSRLVNDEKERLRKDYEKHIKVYTEQHKDRAAEEFYRAEIEGIAMSNASRRLVEEAREDVNFDVSRSAHRLKELYGEELTAVSEAHTIKRMRANARAAVIGEMEIMKDHMNRSERGPVMPTMAGDSYSSYKHGERLLDAILSKKPEDIRREDLDSLSKWVGNVVFYFAQDNGLDMDAEYARMDQLLIRMGYPSLLSDRVHGRPGGGMTMEQYGIRKQYESKVLDDARRPLDVIAA